MLGEEGAESTDDDDESEEFDDDINSRSQYNGQGQTFNEKSEIGGGRSVDRMKRTI